MSINVQADKLWTEVLDLAFYANDYSKETLLKKWETITEIFEKLNNSSLDSSALFKDYIQIKKDDGKLFDINDLFYTRAFNDLVKNNKSISRQTHSLIISKKNELYENYPQAKRFLPVKTWTKNFVKKYYDN